MIVKCVSEIRSRSFRAVQEFGKWHFDVIEDHLFYLSSSN